ncbi:MAG: hypothetical protein NW224_08050 [Leptolyngbyaceae cyanobacterium bins.302]|nr:hypothetical protein [Leptolyngbyaceae cyanobacterium bins.302]
MNQFSCPYLGGEVELTEEREQHITATHPDLLPAYMAQIRETLLDPDQVRQSSRLSTARLFTRWFDTVKEGKYIVVVVVTDASAQNRYWIVTAYIARKLSGGTVEWQKS